MTDYFYEYGDHVYKSQKHAYDILRAVSEIPICKVGTHDFIEFVKGMDGNVCLKCGLSRWKK